MLMNNNFFIITIFALFTALISLVTYSNYINTISKILFILILFIGSIYLIKTFYNSKKIINEDKYRIIKESSNLFKLHFNYAKN